MAESLKVDPMVRLTDALVTDLLNLNDAELLAELAEEGANPDSDAAASRAAIADALIRLAVAGAGKASNASSSGRRSIRQMPTRIGAANLLKRLAGNDEGTANELTLAARNGRGLSRGELEGIVRDLHELGAFGADDPEAE